MTKYKNILLISSAIFICSLTTIFANLAQAQTPYQQLDSDQDGLTDYQEQTIYHTDPHNPDTDGDGFNDGLEIANGYSPLQPKLKMVDVDTDKDGLNDDWEIKLGSDLSQKDTDGDGFVDGIEVANGYSPTDSKRIKVPKLISVDIKAFTLKYSFNGIELESFLVSTGRPGVPTPKGTFSVLNKVPVKNYTGYPNTKWNLHFTTGKNGLRYYIHGAYWHNLFGKKNVSGGCVNVPYSVMERLYNWANVGTPIIIN